MANVDITKAPYYDRFEPENGYTKVLFNPDRPLQQSELNELQSTIEYYMKTTGDAIFADGDIVSGLDFDITETGTGELIVTIHQGMIYLNGKVRQVAEGMTVTLSGTGEEIITARVEQERVTYAEDSSLLDPTIGAPSESSEGADRLKEVVVFSANEEEETIVYQFIDGKLFISRENTGISKIMDVLAERTYDESGSYRVDGFELYTDETQESASFVSLMISAGKAYVQGYKVDKPSASRISVDKSLDTREVIDETTVYANTSGGIVYQKVRLNNRPVSVIRSVTAPVYRSVQVIRSASLAYDELPNSNITTITTITSSKGTAVQGTDFQLENGNRVRWVTGSSKIPPNGETYTVQYNYMKVMVQGTDYRLEQSTSESDSNGFPVYYISFNGMTGDKPVDGQAVHTTYSYYLARKDLVTLDRLGNFIVLKGQPDVLDKVLSPTNNDPLTLELGTITVFPNSLSAKVNSNTVTNIPFSSLQKLVARVQTLEYNLATLSMDVVAQQGHDPVALRGIFADGFNTIEKLDASYEGVLENGVPLQYVAYSFDDAEITLPFSTQKENSMTMLPSQDTDTTFTSNVWGRIITAPYKKVVLINQSIATGIMNVNPYMVFDTAEGALTLNPANDSWIDTEKIIVNNTSSKTYRVNRWWRHNGETWNADSEFIKKNQDAIDWDGGQTALTGGSLAYDKANPRTGVMIQNGGTNTIETAVEFMRSRTVKITAKGLRPYADNLYLVFNGIRTKLTPTGSSTAGSTAGTVRANAKGTVTGSFTVPSGQRCGSVDVEIRNEDSTGSSSASAIYTAQGTKRTIESIINTVRVTVKLYDPLAQSFQVLEDRIVSGVGLYFQSKDETQPVIVQLRGMSDGGQPNRTIYAEKVVDPEDVVVTTKGTAVTQVFFDDPVMAKAGDTYAIVIVTESANYNMFIAKMGQDYLTDPTQKLRTQAYPKGVLFSSSNAQTWTPHQDSDLKFKVYSTEFKEGDAVVEFSAIKDIPNMDKLLVVASYLTPANTGCKWEVRYILQGEDSSVTLDSKQWEPTGNFSDIDTVALVREAQLRATFTANQYMSPMFAMDDFSLMSFLTSLTGSYVGKSVDMTGAEFNTITMSYSRYLPSVECTVTPKFHLGTKNGDGSLKWETLQTLTTAGATVSTSTSQADVNGFVTVSHTIKLPSLKSLFKVRLDLATPTPVLRPRVKTLRCTMTNY